MLFVSVRKRLVLTVAVVATVSAWFLVWQCWLPPRSLSVGSTNFTVSQGEGTRLIASNLQTAGFVRSAGAFVVYTRLVHIQADLKAGTYQLSPSMTVPEIAEIIAGGKGLSDDVALTVPEGMNIWGIDRLLVASKLSSREGVFAGLYRNREGRLFPETYRFTKDATLEDIVVRMTDEFESRANQYTSSQIIIASILEKEAKTPEDMALVSGIIAKRMSLGMPLQVDASVGYGWCLRTMRAGTDCDVTQAPVRTEIAIDGPYNTYTRKGLPVGPISNPGLDALQAAAHPVQSDYLYYLSTRDGSMLVYAETLDKHLKNRLKYLGF